MYGWIWRHLPGATWLKVIQAGVLAMAIVLFLFLVAFPWAEQKIPFLRVTVDEQTSVGALSPLPSVDVSDTLFRLPGPPRR